MRELTLDQLISFLLKRGMVSPEDAREVQVKAPAQQARVARQHVGGPRDRGRGYRVSAPELLASFEVKRADTDKPLTEDHIMQALADALDLPWRRLDPLELDLQTVTGGLSRPFAQRHGCIVIGKDGDALEVALAEPTHRELIENLQRSTGRTIKPVVASKTDIQRIISEFYGFKNTILAAEKEYGREPGLENLERLFQLKTDAELEATDQHIVAAGDFLLKNAVLQRASDIHIEPKRDHGLVRYRIDGVLHVVHRLPRAVMPPLVSRLKMMARMDIAERRKPQDGRIKTVRDEREVEMRVSTLPTAFGEKMVLRIFDPDTLLQEVAGLGFFDGQLDRWNSFLARSHGIVLVTGPTGSGKTTTLYSSLQALATPEVNIVTIEDPIEMVVSAFNQVAVDTRVDLSFAKALRTVLRQDPDIIMVGEIRDLDTARNAVQAALTGHMVFATLHTNDAPSAFSRLIDLGIEPFLVANTVAGVAAQRLLRRNCPHCAVDATLSLAEAGLLGVVQADGLELPVKEGRGCVECRNTGFHGRIGVFEVLPVTPDVRAAVHEGASGGALMQLARREGMMTLHEAALKKLALGETTFSEVLRVTARTDDLGY